MNTFNKLKYITNFCSFATLASSISFTAHADLPLLIEDLVTNKNRFKLEVKLNYINQTTSQLSDPSFTLVALGDGSTLAFPNPTLQGEYNSDTALINLGLRYGIKNNTELGIKINTITTQHRQQISGSSKTTSHARWQDVWLTGQHQLTKNHNFFADSLLFAELNLVDHSQTLKQDYGSSALLGFTTYMINDPILLSMTVSYQYNATRDLTTGGSVDRGDVAGLHGIIGFAINPDITLNFGTGWQWRHADKYKDSDAHFSNTTKTSTNFGFTYAISERSNATINLQSNVSGEGGSNLTVGITTKLGSLPAPASSKYRQNQQQK